MHFLLKEVFHKGLRHLSVVSDLMEAMISKSVGQRMQGGFPFLEFPLPRKNKDSYPHRRVPDILR